MSTKAKKKDSQTDPPEEAAPPVIVEEVRVVMQLRGHRVLSAAPPGTLPVAGPFRPGTEDWMLFRTINDLVLGRISFVLVQEKAKEKDGGYEGVSVWRSGVRQSPA